MNRVPVSAVVLTFNEEKNIETCLQSVVEWCEQIFVVDSGSTDHTLEICHRYTDLVFSHPYVDHASQWDWALKNLPVACEWILPLDADNIVTEKLRRELCERVQNPEPGVNGYFVRHRYFFRGLPIRGFKPYSLRLFRQKSTRMDRSELVDFRFVIEGKTRKLSGVVLESNRNESNIDFWLDKHQKFSSRMAAEEVLRRMGALHWSLRGRFLGNPDERMIWFKNIWYHMPLYVRPFIYFIYRYFLRLGVLDGTNGFLYHFLQAFWFRLIVDMKISELDHKLKSGELSFEQLRSWFVHEF